MNKKQMNYVGSLILCLVTVSQAAWATQSAYETVTLAKNITVKESSHSGCDSDFGAQLVIQDNQGDGSHSIMLKPGQQALCKYIAKQKRVDILFDSLGFLVGILDTRN